MNLDFLDFEQPIAELQAKIDELRMVGTDTEINISDEIARLEEKSNELTKSVFSSLNTWQKTQLSRHPLRPHTYDYISRVFTDFDEMFGDRRLQAGNAIIGGTARLMGEPVMVIGHQKGRNTKENIQRNFGMPSPEEYQKALRLMRVAEKFKLPIFTFIDTPGAYPGIGAEERNQSEAIARNLFEMPELRVPVICTVIGEGGSGGALAIGVGDRLMMLQYSIYSVISPEGCASILWKSAEKAADAATALGVVAENIDKLGLLDEVIPEPLGGAHRNLEEISATMQIIFAKHLAELQAIDIDTLLEQRYQKLMRYGLAEQ